MSILLLSHGLIEMLKKQRECTLRYNGLGQMSKESDMF